MICKSQVKPGVWGVCYRVVVVGRVGGGVHTISWPQSVSGGLCIFQVWFSVPVILSGYIPVTTPLVLWCTELTLTTANNVQYLAHFLKQTYQLLMLLRSVVFHLAMEIFFKNACVKKEEDIAKINPQFRIERRRNKKNLRKKNLYLFIHFHCLVLERGRRGHWSLSQLTRERKKKPGNFWEQWEYSPCQ